MTRHFFLEPVDVLYLRGNKLFGGPGDHGESLMPPWPSIAAGAFRTRILSEQGGISFEDYRNGRMPEGKAGAALGIPDKPGSFRLSFFSPGKRRNGTIHPLFPLPADAAATDGGTKATHMKASPVSSKLSSSYPAPLLPVLAQASPHKPERGTWLSAQGLKRYLRGLPFEKDCLIAVSQLWETDPRLGIALSADTRSAEQGRIYTTEAIVLKKDVGFLVAACGDQGLLPAAGVVRFGGDARAAVFSECRAEVPEPDWAEISQTKRFKLVISTPGLFPKGWLIPGIDEASFKWRWGDITARLVCLSLYQHEVISGWDLVTRRPKPSCKAVPVGSVYWFDELQGPVEKLKEIVENGLWDEETLGLFPQRRPEGFNNVLAACWPR